MVIKISMTYVVALMTLSYIKCDKIMNYSVF